MTTMCTAAWRSWLSKARGGWWGGRWGGRQGGWQWGDGGEAPGVPASGKTQHPIQGWAGHWDLGYLLWGLGPGPEWPWGARAPVSVPLACGSCPGADRATAPPGLGPEDRGCGGGEGAVWWPTWSSVCSLGGFPCCTTPSPRLAISLQGWTEPLAWFREAGCDPSGVTWPLPGKRCGCLPEQGQWTGGGGTLFCRAATKAERCRWPWWSWLRAQCHAGSSWRVSLFRARWRMPAGSTSLLPSLYP